MKRRSAWPVVGCLIAGALSLMSCAPAVTEEEEAVPSAEEEEQTSVETEAQAPAIASTDTPSATRAPLGIHLISQSACGDSQTCYHVRIDYDGLVPREAEIRVSHTSNSEGTVIFLSGGLGNSWYGDASDQHMAIINTMRDEGYETYEIKWLGDQGWGTGNLGQGIKRLTYAIADVVRWIVTDIANNPDIVGATGYSGGANWLAYGLSIHGLDDILDVVVLAAGPAWSDLTALCDIGMAGAKWIVDYCMGWLDSGDYCQGEERPEWVAQALQEQSIVSSIPGELRDYHYPATKVAFIEGELDDPAIVNGRTFYDAITCEKSWVVLEGVGHGVVGDPEGNAAVLEALLEGLEAAS